MKITRKIKRKDVVIELTSDKLKNAYYEQEHLFDKEDISIALQEKSDAGIDISLVNTEEIVEELAVQERRKIDKYDMDWHEAIDTTIEEKLDSLGIER